MSEHKQKIHIYHCCMLYLTDPGLVALFKLGVLKKVWLRPQVGNCLLFSAEPLSVVIHGRCLFTNLSPFMTVWGVTRENSRSFYRWIAESELLHSQIRASHRLGLPERNAQARRLLCPFLFSPNRNLKKSSRLWGSLTPRRWVVTAWPTLRKNAKKKPPSYTPPKICFCRVSAVRREEQRTVRVGEKVAAVLCWMNSDQCFTHRVCDCNPSDRGSRLCLYTMSRFTSLCQDEE